MGNRSKPHRSKTPLLVAASALTRAIDPKEPSRTTILRLLSDAVHTFQESQLVVDAIKARAAAYTARTPVTVATRAQLDIDSRTRANHEAGARALFSIVTAALVKLPSRAGPLKRRATELLRMAGRAAGSAVVMQAAELLRSHISSMKRLTWSDAERGDFEVVCAIMTLADVSAYPIAGREVAKDSLVYLLGQRVRQKCRRSDLAIAIASIVQSFPPHAPPDDRLLDQLLELGLSPTSMKQGSSGVGSAVLVAIVVPHLVSRGSQPADDIVEGCCKAMRSASTATERAMWAVAMVRASVTARRSATYQLLKYGNSETGSKFPSGSNSFNRLPQNHRKDLEENDSVAWVSNETFEESLTQVATSAGLAEGRMDAGLAIAAVLRMWSEALPESIHVIATRTLARLLPNLPSVTAVSALVDGIWLGLLKDLKPSLSPAVFENLLPALSQQSDLSLSAALHLCGTLLQKFGRQCIGESGLSTHYGVVTTTLIAKIHEALDVSSQVVRISSVRVMSALIAALPRTCSQFLAAVLQNLRIADLALETKKPPASGNRTFASLRSVEKELSSVLGNAAALSALIRKVIADGHSVPVALIRQCEVDSLALLRPHQAALSGEAHGLISDYIRRRAGWGLVAALACAKRATMFNGEILAEMFALWKAELGFAGHKSIKNGLCNGDAKRAGSRTSGEGGNDFSGAHFDKLLAASSTRCAALHALYCALQHVPSVKLQMCAKALVGACAARIVSTQTAYGMPTAGGSLGWSTDGVQAPDLSADGKRLVSRLAKFLTVESVQVVQCLSIVPPRGDAAELCYFLALSLTDEAQRLTGETGGGEASDSVLSQASALSPDVSWLQEYAMTNHKSSLLQSSFYEWHDSNLSIQDMVDLKEKEFAGRHDQYVSDNEHSWVFGMQGFGTRLAENVLTSAAVAIAALVSEDLSSSGSLVVSLSSGKLSPSLSAIIALEMSRRVSHSDLAEINRALAVLQVLARRALGVTGGLQKAILSESKMGKLYTPHVQGDGSRFSAGDVPGATFLSMSGKGGWLQWARRFSDEGLIADVPFHDFHTRALGAMYATRTIASDAYRELGSTGGPTLWMGLMRKVISETKSNLNALSPSQAILACNSIAALGALLEVVPDKTRPVHSESKSRGNSLSETLADELDDIVDEALGVLVDAIENGISDVQVVASLSLSNYSYRIAAASERLLGALHNAWARDDGQRTAMGLAGRCAHDGSVWAWCFAHIWKSMGVKTLGDTGNFFEPMCSRTEGVSASLVVGAGAVLSSCRAHWWVISESSCSAVMEMSTELIQWPDQSGQYARTAGMYGMISLWACKIDSARVQYGVSSRDDVLAGSCTTPGRSSRTSSVVLPVEAFSLKESSRVESAAGPFLDEVLYEALAPFEPLSSSEELRVAATTAVMEMIRGAGEAEICESLPRLPEALFATVESGSNEARRILEMLAKSDGKKRPRYWFGLCRAVCLNGDRLNHGVGKSTWDVSYATKHFATKIATEAMDCSLKACSCNESRESGLHATHVTHTCAYGFFRKIVDFAEDICKNKAFDLTCCSEGCRLVGRLAARFASSHHLREGSHRILREYRDIWDSCASIMEGLMIDTAPCSVVENASSATAELLTSFLKLRDVKYFASALGKVAASLEKCVGYHLPRRWLYTDQAEKVNIEVTLAVIANYGRVVTTLRDALSVRSDSQGVVFRNAQAVGDVFLAVVGDFVYSFYGEGLTTIAKEGGAVTSAAVSPSDFRNTLSKHISTVVLAAASSLSTADDLSVDDRGNEWINMDAPGVLLIQCLRERNEISLACLTRLCRQRARESTAMPQTSWHVLLRQVQEALVSICCSGVSMSAFIAEALLSFAYLDVNAFLQFVNHVAPACTLQITAGVFIADVTMSILMFNIRSVGSNYRSRHLAVCDGLRGLTVLTSRLSAAGDKSLPRIQSAALDVIFYLVETGHARELNEEELFLESIGNCLRVCISRCVGSTKMALLCVKRFRRILKHAVENQDYNLMKIGWVLAGALYDVVDCRDVVQQLVAETLLSVGQDKSQPVFDSALESQFGEKLVTSVLCGLLYNGGVESSSNGRVFAYRLGAIGFSKGAPCVSAALRTSIAAIRREGIAAKITNQVGLILYSIFVSKLIQSLPRVADEAVLRGPDGPDRNFTKTELGGVDPAVLRLAVPMLSTGERERLKLLLQAREVKCPAA